MRRIHDGAIGDIVALHCTYNTGALWHDARRSRLERHGMADAQLALLHLAVGRFQRRAARPQPRQDGLGDERPVSGQVPSAWAAGKSAPGRSSATSSTIMPSSTNTPTASSASAIAGSRPNCANDVSDYVMGTEGTAVLNGNAQQHHRMFNYSAPRPGATHGPTPQHVPGRAQRVVRQHPRRPTRSTTATT